MEIQFSGRFEKSQYFTGVYRAFKPSKRLVILRIALAAIFSVILIWAIIGEIMGDGINTSETFRIVRHSITFLVILFIVFQPRIHSYQTANRLWKDPNVRMERSGTVSNQGVSFGTYTQYWDTFIKKDVQADMVVLFNTKQVLIILPRNFFSSDHDWERFTQLVEKKVVEPK